MNVFRRFYFDSSFLPLILTFFRFFITLETPPHNESEPEDSPNEEDDRAPVKAGDAGKINKTPVDDDDSDEESAKSTSSESGDSSDSDKPAAKKTKSVAAKKEESTSDSD